MLSNVHYCLFNILATTLQVWRLSPLRETADMPYSTIVILKKHCMPQTELKICNDNIHFITYCHGWFKISLLIMKIEWSALVLWFSNAMSPDPAQMRTANQIPCGFCHPLSMVSWIQDRRWATHALWLWLLLFCRSMLSILLFSFTPLCNEGEGNFFKKLDIKTYL